MKPRVIIIGAGFGGLYAARGLADKEVDVLLIDRNNYHTFTPLLYQVATSGLDPSHIAYPIRTIFSKNKNIDFLMGTVSNIDYQEKNVVVKSLTETRTESYDYLVIATGTTTNFFGNTKIEQYAFGMKTLSEAVSIRNHILRILEQAAWETNPDMVQRLTTIVVVGGGATGLETSGAIYELYNLMLNREYKSAPELAAKVVLIEASDTVLSAYPEKLRNSAIRQLESLGIEVMLNTSVTDINSDHIVLSNGTQIPTATLIWAAGVRASDILNQLDVTLNRGNRIPVNAHMQVLNRDSVYAIGDITYIEDENGNPYPQVIPVAIQQGKLAAKNVLAEIEQQPLGNFVYRDRGMMATIGRSRAVAYVYNRIPMSGWLAWVSWVILHIVWLMGFRNRLSVFISWLWNYITYDRSVRIILDQVSTKEKLSDQDAR